jgi:hypothetical protein
LRLAPRFARLEAEVILPTSRSSTRKSKGASWPPAGASRFPTFATELTALPDNARATLRHHRRPPRPVWPALRRGAQRHPQPAAPPAHRRQALRLGARPAFRIEPGYADSEATIDQRFAPLAPALARKYGIHHPVCLYTERNLFMLLLEAGASVLRTLTTTYGNVKGVAVRV